jgi:hypothetical protein
MTYRFHIRDLMTGETRIVVDGSEYWDDDPNDEPGNGEQVMLFFWSEGNFGCDCNRGPHAFYRERDDEPEGSEDEYGRELDEYGFMRCNDAPNRFVIDTIERSDSSLVPFDWKEFNGAASVGDTHSYHHADVVSALFGGNIDADYSISCRQCRSKALTPQLVDGNRKRKEPKVGDTLTCQNCRAELTFGAKEGGYWRSRLTKDAWWWRDGAEVTIAEFKARWEETFKGAANAMPRKIIEPSQTLTPQRRGY